LIRTQKRRPGGETGPTCGGGKRNQVKKEDYSRTSKANPKSQEEKVMGEGRKNLGKKGNAKKMFQFRRQKETQPNREGGGGGLGKHLVQKQFVQFPNDVLSKKRVRQTAKGMMGARQQGPGITGTENE